MLAIVVIAVRLSLRGTTVVVAAVGEHAGAKTKESCDQQASATRLKDFIDCLQGSAKRIKAAELLRRGPAVELLATHPKLQAIR
jgi:hypothetical protein